MKLLFSRLPPGSTTPSSATLDRIDSTHANPFAAWVAAGGPQYCSPQQIAAEMAASQLVPEPLQLVAEGAGVVAVTLQLEPFSVARVRFSFTVEA